ncbi:uncharacterized protein RCC_04446 [Ramularia collo-cygni]|uniref:Uncharacterized protein n=1 Tax=Ramularia collo-cygni TaxID=112498 RepID=A0A2D3UPR3_9PEZI|nr:uncharacterized protein RCC_04446 [Ramularia collo-cygni]CZT18602.1 uncharacterized protein RCC_04446 [Ramularia collo-cygni]
MRYGEAGKAPRGWNPGKACTTRLPCSLHMVLASRAASGRAASISQASSSSAPPRFATGDGAEATKSMHFAILLYVMKAMFYTTFTSAGAFVRVAGFTITACKNATRTPQNEKIIVLCTCTSSMKDYRVAPPS